MLATPELIREAAQRARVDELRSRWRSVPLYQSAGRRVFSEWPLLGKADVRRNFPANFLPPDTSLDHLLAKKSVELEHTSGSSEERMAVLFTPGWWNEQEARALRLNAFVARALDAQLAARRATLVPPVCNGLVCFSNFTSKTDRTLGAALSVNPARIPFLLSEGELEKMAGEIADWSPLFLDLDPVHGAWFALFCERRGIRFPSLQFILSSYEFASVVHRRILRRVFGVPVFNLYGSTETGHLLMENERGEMQTCLDNAFLEVVDTDAQGVGELVATTLTNDLMPLVRYRIGDLVERIETPYATRWLVHGRRRDALRGRDGTRVTTLMVDRCFVDARGIAHYQLRQMAAGGLELKFISDREPPTTSTLNAVVGKLEVLLAPPAKIRCESVDKLPPLPSGKFRLTERA